MRGLFTIVACVVFFAHVESGASGLQTDLHSLLAVKSVAELEKKTRESISRKRGRDTCEAELAARLLPRSCFRELSMSASALRPLSMKARRDRLNRICIESAKASRSRLDLSRSLEELPTECQQASRERIEDLQYMDEPSSPQTSVTRTLGPELEETSRD